MLVNKPSKTGRELASEKRGGRNVVWKVMKNVSAPLLSYPLIEQISLSSGVFNWIAFIIVTIIMWFGLDKIYKSSRAT